MSRLTLTRRPRVISSLATVALAIVVASATLMSSATATPTAPRLGSIRRRVA